MSFERLRFAFLNLNRDFRQHRGMLMLSVLLVFFLSSILFISGSIERSFSTALDAQPDFVVQKTEGGRVVPIQKNIYGELIEIPGTTLISARVWGRYTFANTQHTVVLMGVDFLDEQGHDVLQKLIKTIDLSSFLHGRKQMIVGEGVAKWMKEEGWGDSLRFFTPKGQSVDLKLFDTFEKGSALFSNDIVLTDIKTAHKILGLKRGYVTDFTFDVPNELEWEIIPIKVASLDYNLRIISKKESKKAYEELFDYTSGMFLLMFLMVLLAFVMVLYQRYSVAYSIERKRIGILRALGWSVKDLLIMKFYESGIVVLLAYLVGVSLAWNYVFMLDAPLLSNIFMGSSNFEMGIKYVPFFDIFELTSIFLLFALPYMATVLIPVWKISTISPKEAMV